MNAALRKRVSHVWSGTLDYGTPPVIAFREQCRILGFLRTHVDRPRTPVDVSDKAGGGLDHALNGG
jgi:hypothetical protein